MTTGGNSITLSDGRVLTVDLASVTMREYRSIFAADTTAEQEDVIFAKLLGLTPDELIDLTMLDYKQAKLFAINVARNPLAVPNSPSVSTSP